MKWFSEMGDDRKFLMILLVEIIGVIAVICAAVEIFNIVHSTSP